MDWLKLIAHKLYRFWKLGGGLLLQVLKWQVLAKFSQVSYNQTISALQLAYWLFHQTTFQKAQK